MRIRYISKSTNNPIASDKVMNIVAGKSDTYTPDKLIGYKYSDFKIGDRTGTDEEVIVEHKFAGQILLFYYDDDNYDVTLHVKHSGSATWTPKLWAWYDTELGSVDIYDKWPGQSLTKGDDGWFTTTFKVANGVDYSLIINNGTVQTKDYKGVSGTEKWIIINDDKIIDKGNFLTFYDTNPDLIG